MEAGSGRLFGPGLPGTGAAALAHWRGGDLVVDADGRERVAVAPTVDARGFNADQIRIEWPGDGGNFVYMFDPGPANRDFVAAAPAGFISSLQQATKRKRRLERRFRLGWVVLGTFLLLPFLALAAFILKADAIAGWAVARVPHRVEAQLGDLVLAQTRARTRLSESGPAVDALRLIGEKLTVGSAHRYRWFVAEGPEVNAFAAPGGVVVVYAGLIRAAESPEEVAGVIAHEVAHAELRHGLRGAAKALGLRALLAIVLGDAGGMVELAGEFATLGFSRDAEREADAEGLRRLVAAGIDPRGMLVFFSRLAQKESSVQLPAILSTHPATAERIENLRARLETVRGESVPLAIDWPAVKAASAPR